MGIKRTKNTQYTKFCLTINENQNACLKFPRKILQVFFSLAVAVLKLYIFSSNGRISTLSYIWGKSAKHHGLCSRKKF